MKTFVKVFFIVILSTTISFAQYAPDTLWTKTFGVGGLFEGYSVQQTADGGYIITGYTTSGPEGLDIWLIKTDESGDTLWTKTFGGGDYDFGSSVQQTTDGGYIITGYTESVGEGGRDVVWLIKTDESGDTLWTKTFGGDDNDAGFSVQQTADLGYIITGYTESVGAGGKDVWLIKTNESGDTLWTKTFGGSSDDCGYSVQQTVDEGYIITGYTSPFGVGYQNVWLIKADESGDTLWTKTIGGGLFDYGSSVQQTADLGYIITGYTSSFGVGSYDVWLIKTDESGDTLWTKTFGGSSGDRGYSVQQTVDGGYIITGYTESFGVPFYHRNVWLIKIAPELNNIDNDEQNGILSAFTLYQNYPNPFNPSTIIEFTLPKSEFVELKIFNILGKEVTTLVSNKLNQGNHPYTFDGKNLASGIYYYQLVADDYREVKKMILLR